jgi:hypothetical protein
VEVDHHAPDPGVGAIVAINLPPSRKSSRVGFSGQVLSGRTGEEKPEGVDAGGRLGVETGEIRGHHFLVTFVGIRIRILFLLIDDADEYLAQFLSLPNVIRLSGRRTCPIEVDPRVDPTSAPEEIGDGRLWPR